MNLDPLAPHLNPLPGSDSGPLPQEMLEAAGGSLAPGSSGTVKENNIGALKNRNIFLCTIQFFILVRAILDFSLLISI